MLFGRFADKEKKALTSFVHLRPVFMQEAGRSGDIVWPKPTGKN